MTLSEFATAVSIAVGLIAIALAIVFFWWSWEKSASIDRAVQRLDDVVGRLYADLFGEYRTTMADLRKHMFTQGGEGDSAAADVEARANAKVAEVEERLEGRLAEILKGQTDASRAVSQVMEAAKAAGLASRTIDEQARQESVRQAILTVLESQEAGSMHARQLYLFVAAMVRGGILQSEVWDVVQGLAREWVLGVTGEGRDAIVFTREGGPA